MEITNKKDCVFLTMNQWGTVLNLVRKANRDPNVTPEMSIELYVIADAIVDMAIDKNKEGKIPKMIRIETDAKIIITVLAVEELTEKEIAECILQTEIELNSIGALKVGNVYAIARVHISGDVPKIL